MSTASRAQPLHPHTRRSPYFDRTEALGASEYMPYNHMYMPMSYGRDPRDDYQALTERVTLWDVGAERQTELRGPGALALADLLTTRSLADLGVGGCRYTICCDAGGQIICDPVLLRPWPDVVWLSHGSVDLTLWAAGLALGGGHDAEVSEPDAAPLQVQGPLAPALLGDLLGPALDELRPFRCTVFELAGVDCVISRTGWSGGPGYEVYPLSSARALDVWDAIVAAGERHGLLVTGPNVARAMERGITDISYATNQDLNPLELWQSYLVDLDKGPFIGRDALLEVHRRGPARRQVGLLGPAERLPRLEGPWPLLRDGAAVGDTRWASYSFALERAIAIGVVEAELAELGGSVEVEHPAGRTRLEICPLPFVD
jgi:aminomethyltransferase